MIERTTSFSFWFTDSNVFILFILSFWVVDKRFSQPRVSFLGYYYILLNQLCKRMCRKMGGSYYHDRLNLKHLALEHFSTIYMLQTNPLVLLTSIMLSPLLQINLEMALIYLQANVERINRFWEYPNPKFFTK